jgi:hypothetical protein
MRRILTLVPALFLAVAAMAQPAISFETTNHDFGTIKEDDGKAVFTYKFKNTGTEPLKLTAVQPACGCTAAEWTKEDIAPGKSGYIKAEFDPSHRPGRFDKSITVHTNATPSLTLLTFGGYVLPHVKTMEDSFPQISGDIRFESNYLNFGMLPNNQKDTFTYLSLVNTGVKPITIKELHTENDNVKYVWITGLPVTVKPNERKKIQVHYNASLVNDYGMLFDRVSIRTDDEKAQNKAIDVIADVKQYVPHLSDEELAKAPKAVFATNTYDFGNVTQGEMVKTDFKFTNKGKSDLLIYKVKTSCGCTASEPEKKMLKPGESSVIHVTFNSAGKHGAEEKNITVYTNDPTGSEITLTIKANVTSETQDNKK